MFGLDLGLLLLIGGVGISAAGTAYSGYQQKKAYDAQAKQAEATARYNAKVAENEAEQERLNRQRNEAMERRQARRRRAAIEAAYAKSGVLIEGTPAQYLQEQAATDEYNIQSATQASEKRRKRMLHQADTYLVASSNKASAYEAAGQTALVGSGFKVAGQAASTATTAYDRGYFDKWMGN